MFIYNIINDTFNGLGYISLLKRENFEELRFVQLDINSRLYGRLIIVCCIPSLEPLGYVSQGCQVLRRLAAL
jgi:hypothetical protein